MLFPKLMYHLGTKKEVTVTGFTHKESGLMRCKMPDETWKDLSATDLLDLAEVHCCPKCGSPEILYPVWRDPNSGSIGNLIEGTEGHCTVCESMFNPHQTVTLIDYKTQQTVK